MDSNLANLLGFVFYVILVIVAVITKSPYVIGLLVILSLIGIINYFMK